MGIEIPGEVTWLFPVVVGQSWPEGDETALRRMADAYRAAARGVQSVIDEGNGAASSVVASQAGGAGEEFREYWQKFSDGDDSYLSTLRKTCEELAESCDNTASEVEYAKLSIIAALVALAIEIAALVAAAFGTFGASTAGVPIAQQATRLIVQFAFRQLVIAILGEVVISVGVDATTQAVQVARGDREAWDRGGITEAAVPGAVSAAVPRVSSGVVGGVPGGLKVEGGEPTGQVPVGATRGAVEGAVPPVGPAVSPVGPAAVGQDIPAQDVPTGASPGGVSGSIGGAKDGLPAGPPRVDGSVGGLVGGPVGSPGWAPVSRDGLNRPPAGTTSTSAAAPAMTAPTSFAGGGDSSPATSSTSFSGTPGGRPDASVPTFSGGGAGPSIGSRLGPAPASPAVGAPAVGGSVGGGSGGGPATAAPTAGGAVSGGVPLAGAVAGGAMAGGAAARASTRGRSAPGTRAPEAGPPDDVTPDVTDEHTPASGHEWPEETATEPATDPLPHKDVDTDQGARRPAFVTDGTWHRMEQDSAKFTKSGGTVEVIDTVALRDPLHLHPHTYQTRWRVTLADGTTEIHVRSYPNEHDAAL
ncbi:WXG100-like domain-containing protein [Saccharothrix sp. NRRL B-16314]|uniref:WXG100-like domain-containing protein n=1 Tax=Saccharothrix sp. NRRL B-16314 TaxID=1463825 RepID=UPI000524E775|nr:hypothetical protein [Saccharothrix sp. NRRL B-16314]